MASPASDALIPEAIAAILIDPAAYADQRAHDAYAWLRANQPLGLAAPEGYDPFWVVSKHADIMEVGRQNTLFASGLKQTGLISQAALAKIREASGGLPVLARALTTMDPPDHAKYRALTQVWFMPQNLARFEARIRKIARRAVDDLIAGGGRCDFVRDLAFGYPLRVIMAALGLPEEDEAHLLALTQQLFGSTDDPDTARSGVDHSDPARAAHQLAAVVADFRTYFSKIAADRRAHPRGDLASVIANATFDGQPIGPKEELGYYIIVATAGHDTTSSSTAAGMLALCEAPAEFARVKADPSLIPGFVEEAIRWASPVRHFLRTAVTDTELSGRKIAQGDLLMLCFASGNRDEDVFTDPYVFRSDRKPNKQIAFGYGAHFCIGHLLAKLEMRILFEELLPRLKSVGLTDTPQLSHSTHVNGLKSLPMQFEVA